MNVRELIHILNGKNPNALVIVKDGCGDPVVVISVNTVANIKAESPDSSMIDVVNGIFLE